MASRIHQVKYHKLAVRGIEAMTLVSNHHFPRHSHDQFVIGVIAFGAQRSWSGVGLKLMNCYGMLNCIASLRLTVA
jgi:hypothetical protein